MSRFTKYIKRAVHYILHGQPILKVCPNIVTLSQNELLQGRTALITGGTKGIGQAIAIAFLDAGANVIITSRTQENADKTVGSLKERYPLRTINGIALDNEDIEQMQSRLDDLLKRIEPLHIDILVNNAGVVGGCFGSTSEAEWNKVIDTNLRGVFFLSEYVTKYMIANQIKGNILMVASSSSLRPALSAYTISKWGLRGFVMGLAKSCSKYGITVNGVAPGPTATEMLGVQDTSDIYLKTSPILRYALPEEIANMATILCSDMGRTIVGDIVYMTGGAGLITFDDMNYNI